MKHTKVRVKGFSLLTMMFLIMFALKLAGPMATASWWLVTAPLWAPFTVFAVLALIGAAILTKIKV